MKWKGCIEYRAGGVFCAMNTENTSGQRVWLITGCSSGFGAEIARAALAAGDRVVATARDVSQLSDLAAIDECRVMTLDVTQPAAVASVLKEAHAVWGRLDVVVNNAGAGLLGALEEANDREIEACMAVNFFGPLNVMRAAVPLLREGGGGHIVNISAAAAIANYAGFAIYGAAKAALEAASESLRAEVAPAGVKVTVVQPGPFRTEFIGRSLWRTAVVLPEYEGTVGKFAMLLGRMKGRQPGDPARAAAVIVEMVRQGRAPMRLVLGKYAVKKVRDTATARLRELEEFESESVRADFGA